jgi:hypothetical protein
MRLTGAKWIAGRVRPTAAVVVVLLGLIAPGARAATVTLGQLFTPTGADSCTDTELQTAAAAGTSYVVSAPGVITSWSFHTDATTPTGLKFKVGRNDIGTSYTIVGEATAGAETPNAVNTYPASIPVRAGDMIGIFGGDGDCATFTSNAGDVIEAQFGDISAGVPTVFVSSSGAKVPVSAQEVLAPGIGSLSSSAGPDAGGTTVTITGHDFAGASAVDFGGTPARFTVDSDTTITAVAPAAAPGTVDVSVDTAGGQSPTSPADQFTYVRRPTVTTVTPARGPRVGGTTVTITGSDFTGATAVSFGDLPARGFGVVSDTLITAIAPAGPAGVVDVSVTTTGGSSPTTAADSFTFAQICTVPALKGKKLRTAEKALRRAHCSPGKVSGPTKGKVKHQSRTPHQTLPAGTIINITLA